MTVLKVTGIIVLMAALLVSGGLYFKNNATVQQQQANQVQAADDEALNDPQTEDEFDVFSEPPLQQDDQSEAENDGPSVQSIPGIQGGSRQIIAIQQQIEARMVSCVQNAERTRGIYANLRAQEAQLDARRRALSDQISGTDTSTPAGRERRDRLRAERDRLGDQLSDVRDQQSDVRRGWFQFRSACRNDVNRLRSAANRADNALFRQFNQDTGIRFFN